MGQFHEDEQNIQDVSVSRDKHVSVDRDKIGGKKCPS
jgi:hypothetical protein